MFPGKYNFVYKADLLLFLLLHMLYLIRIIAAGLVSCIAATFICIVTQKAFFVAAAVTTVFTIYQYARLA
jgi:hypothetical protein